VHYKIQLHQRRVLMYWKMFVGIGLCFAIGIIVVYSLLAISKRGFEQEERWARELGLLKDGQENAERGIQ
jgi:hypothetical protein